jgi:hypothetical protein
VTVEDKNRVLDEYALESQSTENTIQVRIQQLAICKVTE